MLSLSASQPTVSAIVLPFPRLAHGLPHRLVDALDQVVALLIQRVDATLGGGHAMIIVHPRTVFFVPELDVRLREAGDELADRVIHGATRREKGWRGRANTVRMLTRRADGG